MAQATPWSAVLTGTAASKKSYHKSLIAYGAYKLFSRQHNMMFGGSYSKQNNCYFNVWTNVLPDEIGKFSTFNGNFPQTN